MLILSVILFSVCMFVSKGAALSVVAIVPLFAHILGSPPVLTQ